MRIRRTLARLAAIVMTSALAVGATAIAASAHGGPITIDVSPAVTGSTVTYSVHLSWTEDGHDVIGQGIVINASGPGGTRSASLPASNSSGRTSGSITLADGTWSVTFETDGGTRTISQKIGADPVTSPPPTPAPTVAPGPAPTAAPAPTAPPTTRRVGGATTTTRPGATTTTIAPTDTTPTTVAGVVETTVAPDTSTTSSTSSTTSSTSTSIAVTEIASSSAKDDDGGGSGGLVAVIAVVALVLAGVGAAVWRRRVSAAPGSPSAGVPGE